MTGRPMPLADALRLAELRAHRYGKLEEAIERETDPAKKAELERDLLRAKREGRFS